MQTTLFDQPDIKSRLERAFEEFHWGNPSVYKLFKKFAFEVIRKGHQQYSADAIMHRVRWETNVVTSDDEFKVNNNHVAFYARMFMRDFPEYKGFFRLRKSEAD